MKEIDFEAIRQTAFENCTKHFDDDDLSKAVVLQAKLASVIAKEMLTRAAISFASPSMMIFISLTSLSG